MQDIHNTVCLVKYHIIFITLWNNIMSVRLYNKLFNTSIYYSNILYQYVQMSLLFIIVSRTVDITRCKPWLIYYMFPGYSHKWPIFTGCTVPNPPSLALTRSLTPHVSMILLRSVYHNYMYIYSITIYIGAPVYLQK